MLVNGLRAAGPNRFRTEHAAVPDPPHATDRP
jgi:hypothetical protein